MSDNYIPTSKIDALTQENALLRNALTESVSLQSHYARLLNQWDGGMRRAFTVDEWLARLNELSTRKDQT